MSVSRCSEFGSGRLTTYSEVILRRCACEISFSVSSRPGEWLGPSGDEITPTIFIWWLFRPLQYVLGGPRKEDGRRYVEARAQPRNVVTGHRASPGENERHGGFTSQIRCNVAL
jgi:hypothetical protein